MGSSTSATLAIIYMDRIEKQAICSLQIGLYKRYVDDICILTVNKEEADKILTHMNSVNEHIRFEIEHPDSSNSLSLLDFTLTVNPTSKAHTFNFFKKKAKKDLFVNYTSALSTRNKINYIQNEIDRIKNKCSNEETIQANIQNFAQILHKNDYPPDFVKQHCTHKNTKKKRRKEPADDGEPMYFEFPFVSDAVDAKVKRIFHKNGLNVRLYRKSTTIRQKLKKTKMQKCTKKDCPINNPVLCHKKMCVYSITCDGCKNQYVGSTIRHLHTRADEHSKSPSSSVHKHALQCKSSFTYKVISTARDIVKLRFLEAIQIKNINPKINSKEESNEINHLIFT